MATAIRTAAVAAIAALCGLATTAEAQVLIPTSVGNGADALLQNDTQDAGTGPDVNRGSTTRTILRVNANSRIKVPIFRFDISGVSGDLSNAAVTFDIAFNNGNRSRDVQVYGIVDGALDLFDETEIDYASAPGINYTDPNPATPELEPTSQLVLDTSEVVFLGNFQVVGSGPQSTLVPSVVAGQAPVDLTSFLNSDTNGLVTLLFTRGNDGNVIYEIRTKEDTTGPAPTLVLPNAVIPEPATLGLLGAAGLGLLRRRR